MSLAPANVFWPLRQPDPVGPIIGADDVRDRVKHIIEKWSPYYIATVSERLEDGGKIGGDGQMDAPLPDFGVWTNEPQYRTFGTGQSPSFLVTVPQIIGEPVCRSDGSYIAVFRAQVITEVFGTTWEEAADLIAWYETVVRLCILQNRSLEQFAMSTKWSGMTIRSEEHDGTRTRAQAVSLFDVQVGNVINVLFSPTEPPFPPEPPPPDETVESTLVTVLRVPPDQPMPQ